MKILIFYQYFGTPSGSWSTRFYEFARRWVQAGHEVTIVTAPYEKSDIKAKGFISRQTIEGINLVVINTPDSNRVSILKRAFNSVVFSITSSYFALTQKTDLVISSSGPITIGIPGLLAKFFRRKPFIFEIRDLWPGGGIEMGKIKNKRLIHLALSFEKLLYNNANLVVACSGGQKNNIQKRYSNVKCVTIPHGSDLELFDIKKTNSEISADAKLFTHIGSLGFIHNCKLILEAAHIIKKSGRENDIKIIFIGDGAERNALELIKRNLELNNIEFWGLLPKKELPKWVKSSRATLFTTLDNETQNTSCPNKIFDSFAAGVPIIQTTTGWIKELIEKENCGINVSPNNPKELADAILKMADDEILHEKLSVNAGRVARTLFNRDVLANQYLEEIKLLLK